MIGLFQEYDPCRINNDNSTDMTLNPFSWNNEVNMLYIDQLGFSFGNRTIGTSHQAAEDKSFHPHRNRRLEIRQGMAVTTDQLLPSMLIQILQKRNKSRVIAGISFPRIWLLALERSRD